MERLTFPPGRPTTDERIEHPVDVPLREGVCDRTDLDGIWRRCVVVVVMADGTTMERFTARRNCGG